MYIYQRNGWPQFTWNVDILFYLINEVRYKQGRLLGKMESLGFQLQEEANLETVTQDVLKSSEIEGELLNADQVHSSVRKHLGMDVAGLVKPDRHVDGVVKMVLDATQHYKQPLTKERLFEWHCALFPSTGYNIRKLVIGKWRDNGVDDPMQVVSGPAGKETVHFQAPDAAFLDHQMQAFFDWYNETMNLDPVIKAGIAHLWFVTIHPFDDGNGRIARAITDMQFARADETEKRFYSMSAQIRKDRKTYYRMLEKTQKGDLDITEWLEWFLSSYHRALSATEEMLARVIQKGRFWDNAAGLSLNYRQRLLVNKLLDGFTGKLTTSKWAKIAKCSQDTAGRDVNDLIEKGLMKKEEGGGRSTSYTLAFSL